jgi:hypothetical protein
MFKHWVWIKLSPGNSPIITCLSVTFFFYETRVWNCYSSHCVCIHMRTHRTLFCYILVVLVHWYNSFLCVVYSSTSFLSLMWRNHHCMPVNVAKPRHLGFLSWKGSLLCHTCFNSEPLFFSVSKDGSIL